MSSKKLESKFQADLIEELKKIFPDAIIYKNNSLQGLPDLTILNGSQWALLECKRDKSSVHACNQDYYVDLADHMSFARFIYPENKEEVIHELQQAFGTKGPPRHIES